MGTIAVKKEIRPDTVLQREGDLLFNQIDGEVVMLSIENSEYYGINKIGSRIWELLENPMKFSDLIMKLMDEYNVSEQICIDDTFPFLKNILEKRLIKII